MEQLKSLTKVSDGVFAPIAGIAAVHFVTVAPWIALWLGIHFISGGTLALFLAGAAGFAGWIAFAWLPDATQTSEPGVWLTARKALWSRWIDRAAPLAGLGVSLVAALTADLRGAAPWAIGYLLVLAVAFAAQAVYSFWRGRASLTREVELRVDAEGFHARDLAGTLAWNEIERIAPRERGDRQVVRLVLRPNTAPGLSRSRREEGGLVLIALDSAGASREEVVAAMVAAQPSLGVVAEAPAPAMVQPIVGAATDDSPPDDAAVIVPVLIGVAIGGVLN